VKFLLTEFEIGVYRAESNPRCLHFDDSGLRRGNLERFPYHRNPRFGLKRFIQ
jgi:hypothetical protein